MPILILQEFLNIYNDWIDSAVESTKLKENKPYDEKVESLYNERALLRDISRKSLIAYLKSLKPM